jgi:hypothetical protein
LKLRYWKLEAVEKVKVAEPVKAVSKRKEAPVLVMRKPVTP